MKYQWATVAFLAAIRLYRESYKCRSQVKVGRKAVEAERVVGGVRQVNDALMVGPECHSLTTNKAYLSNRWATAGKKVCHSLFWALGVTTVFATISTPLTVLPVVWITT